jgi:hypothetical protein
MQEKSITDKKDTFGPLQAGTEVREQPYFQRHLYLGSVKKKGLFLLRIQFPSHYAMPYPPKKRFLYHTLLRRKKNAMDVEWVISRLPFLLAWTEFNFLSPSHGSDGHLSSNLSI